MSNENVTFDIKVTMKWRWVPHFLAMLKHMEWLGVVGSSRSITFFADGDGDFRPRFEWSVDLPSNAEPVSNEQENRVYDAG